MQIHKEDYKNRVLFNAMKQMDSDKVRLIMPFCKDGNKQLFVYQDKVKTSNELVAAVLLQALELRGYLLLSQRLLFIKFSKPFRVL